MIGLDPAGPAGSILPELERLDVPLLLLDGKESVRACGAIAAAIADGAVHHRGESELLAAAGGASRRPVGDDWKWSRKDSTVDISPLVAATMAVGYGCATPRARSTLIFTSSRRRRGCHTCTDDRIRRRRHAGPRHVQ